MIFDTHVHYDDEQFDKDREELLKSLPENGIEYVVNVGASIESTKKTLELTQNYNFIYGAVGVHPSETGELNEDNFRWLKDAARSPKIVAIGEIGLDYYWKEPEIHVQKKWFQRQMELARELKLPMVIHSRDASRDTLEMMEDAKAGDMGGVIHCYSYSLETARIYLDMGFYIGIGGVLTFNNAKKLREVVEYTPLDRILLETDCPYLAPMPNRGKRNSSLNLTYVAEKIAEVKGVDYNEVLKATNVNAKRMYRI